MSTLTIRVTSSAVNSAGTGFGQQPDLAAPSYFDVVVTDSGNSHLPNGTYDAYCLNPDLSILFSPTTHTATTNNSGSTIGDYIAAGAAGAPTSSITESVIDQINWLLAQNFTLNANYGGQYNYGEVQAAIWELLGYTPADYADAAQLLSDNGRNTVSQSDINFLVQQSQAAVASGSGVVPTDTFFSTLIDPEGNGQPLIIQLNSAKLGDQVWLDSNADGIQDAGELGVNDVVVELYDGNGDLVATTITGDDYSTAVVEQGFYQFSGLAAGDYSVKFITPVDMALTVRDANSNGNDASDSDADQVSGETATITLTSGESNLTVDAGLVETVLPASLGDYVWEDKNGDGQQNDGAASGINGVTVNLKNAAGAVIATQVTANDVNGNGGYYLFDNLTPGDYSVEFIKPSGFEFTTQDQGADGSDSDVDSSTGMTVLTTLVAGENDLSWDAGLIQLASLGDKVWGDTNGNGVQDAGEAGIAGVTIELKDVNNNVISTTTTDANGNYGFDVAPGTYSVGITPPAGYILSPVNQGGDDAVDSDFDPLNNMSHQVTLASGDNDTTIDAGLYAPVETAELGDHVWYDADCDGVRDDDEVGAAGVFVNLKDANGSVIATTSTDANGNYLFSGLEAGTYSVGFEAPEGYIFTHQDATSDDRDSDANASGMTANYTLAAGESNLSVDAGLSAFTTSRVEFDFNGNSASSGAYGNSRSFTENGISVNVSAFSRDANNGEWSTSYLGSFSGGLGVTNREESGSGSTHTVDNRGDVDDYVLFEFDQAVTVDSAFLGYVYKDSDMSVWIGTVDDAFTSHISWMTMFLPTWVSLKSTMGVLQLAWLI